MSNNELSLEARRGQSARPLRGLLLLALLCAPLALAQTAAPTQGAADESPYSSIAVDVIERRAEEVAASTSLDEQTRNTLAELYRKAIGSLQTAASFREAAKAFERAIGNAPEETADLRRQIEAMKAQPPAQGADYAQLPLDEIEQRLVAEQARVASLASSLAELKGSIEKEQARPVVIRQRTGDAGDRLAQLQEAQAAKAAAGEDPDLAQARRWANLARAEELRAEVLMLGQELASHPMRLELLEARRDLAALELQQVERRVETLQDLVNQIRLEATTEAKISAQVAELSAADQPPVVAELAARNTELSRQVEALAAGIDEIEREERRSTEQAQRIEESFNATRKKIEVAGVSQILGRVLQEQRRNLPDTSEARRTTRLREKKIAEASLSQILLEEERDALRDIPGYVAGLSAGLPAEVQAQVAEPMAKLAANRLALIEQALTVQRHYLQALGELDIAQSRLEAVVDRLDEFLAERLLWVRSSRVAGLETMRLVPEQLADLVAPEQWSRVVETLTEPITLGWILVVLLIAAALRARRRRLYQALRDAGKDVGKLLRDRLSHTVRAIAIILLIALPWPLLMATAGWRLREDFDAANFTKDVGGMLIAMGLLLFQLSLLRVFVAPGSVADAHFGWREPGLKRLRRDLAWFSPLLVWTGAFTMLSFASATQNWGSGLGRGAFLVVMLLVAMFFYRLARPNGGTLSVLLADHQDGAAFRLRHLWFVLLFGAPLVAGAMSLAGYMYTAGTLIAHILNTAWFVLLVIVLHQFVIRWLVLDQRQLRLQAARERRRAEQEARVAQGQPEETEGVLARDLEEPKIDLNALDAASRRLTNNAMLLIALVGIWAIWNELLPALGVLDEVTLWTYSKPGVEGLIPITLSSLGLVLLIFVVMMITIRQLPAFLEITLLQRMHLTQGSRYTVVTLTKYTVVAIGVAWIFSTLGGSWSEIQWIFAALGVGIGFGLQEIVANFISGLIILFERPIRVGDVVTVGNTDGVVTRIRIRATTIRNWDQKELLVPNKNFITQELLNWSLSDQTTRILIRIGVAYGSDVQRAMSIMEQAAKSHSRVLAEPAPFVVFEEFGDNALTLSLRCYIDNIDYRLRTVTDINLAINQAMNEAGVEIAFPQRDVHLDTRRPLEVRIRNEAGEAQS